MTAPLDALGMGRHFNACFRALAVVAACLAAPVVAAERLVLYVNEDSERVAVALAKLQAALKAQDIANRHQVRLEHVRVDYADMAGLRRALRAAQARAPAAMVAASALIAQAAREEGISVPVIFGMHQNPMEAGLATSLRRPGGTMTGLTLYRSDEGKRLELLREVAPHARRLGVIIDQWWDRAPDDRYPSASVLQRLAEDQGFQVEYIQIDTLEALERLPERANARGVDAWYVPPTWLGFDHPAHVARVVSSTRKPAIYALSLYAQSGGLLSYQTVFEDPFSSWAKMIALILDGFPVGEIPVERPRAFELAVNVKAAREQGITIPKSILVRATHFY